MAGLLHRLSSRWLNCRRLLVLYRGQREASPRILSPLARRDPAASAGLVDRMRAAGLTDLDIAGFASRWHDHPVPLVASPPGLAGLPLGAVGVSTTRILGMAARFAAGGVVHVLRVPASLALSPGGWPCFEMEAEHIVLNAVPAECMARQLPADRVPALAVNGREEIVLVNRGPS